MKPRSKPSSLFSRSEGWVLGIWVVIGLLMLVWLIQAFHKAYRAEGYDLTPRFEAAKALLQGTDPYKLQTPFPLTYPLFICVLFIPLTWLPYGLANLVWFGVSAGCLFYLWREVLKAFRPSLGVREMTLVLGAFFLEALIILQNNFVNGQVNIFVVALCVLCFRSLSSAKPMAAGWALAGAIAFKLTPLVLVGYLVLRREWKALFWTLVGTLALGFGLPYLFAGSAILGYYQGYLTGYILPSFLALSPTLTETFQFRNYLHALVPSLLGLPLSFLSDLLVLLPLAWVQFRVGDGTLERKEIAIFSCYLAVSLWLSPISETHHLAALFPGFFLLIQYGLMERAKEAWWKRTAPLMLIFILLWTGLHQFVLYFLVIGLCYALLLIMIVFDRPEKKRGKIKV